MTNKLAIVALGLLFHLGSLAQSDLPIDKIEGYFLRVKQISEKDNGKLWGKPIYGPILVIDRETRKLVANEPDYDNLLKKDGTVYTGSFPENLIISNSTTQFGGKLWTMVSFPFYGNDRDIDLLFTHELFHRLQKVIGLQDNGYDNSHMSNIDARVYLKLEWLALLTAINSKNKQNDALLDALIFREYRRSLFAGADSMENKFEIAEGIAEYTAYQLCFNSNEIVPAIISRKTQSWNSESYVRSFGYYSGLLYGYLLDEYNNDWRKTLKYNDDLGAKLQDVVHISLPVSKLEIPDIIKTRRNSYGYDTIYAYEFDLMQEKEKALLEYRQKFTSTSVIHINLTDPHFGFDPNNLLPLDSLGTIFPFIELVDEWGKLKVTEGGCLVSKDWKMVVLSSVDMKKSNNEIKGKGWSIKLNEDWVIIEENERYFIIKKH